MTRLLPMTLYIIAAHAIYADPSPEAQQFLAVPGAAWHYKNDVLRDFAASEFPADAMQLIKSYDWGTQNGNADLHLRGFTLDVNGDGRLEYFVLTVFGGSGGPNFMVLTDTGHGWKAICNYQGVLHIMPATNGWPKLVTTIRGGGENFAKVYLEFRHGGYEQTAIERFERGKITRENSSSG